MDVKLHTFLTSALKGNELYASYCGRLHIRRKDSQAPKTQCMFFPRIEPLPSSHQPTTFRLNCYGSNLLLLALQLSVSFGLLNNSLPCFSIHSHLIPAPNPHFFQTSSSHLNLVLPILLIAIGLHSVIIIIVTVLSVSIFTIYSIHLILCAFIYITISVCLISKSISSLLLIFQLTSCFFNGPHIYLITLLSNTLHCCSLMTVHIKRPNFNHILMRCPADLGTYRRPVGFVVDRAELGQVFFRVRRFALIHSFIHSFIHSSPTLQCLIN